MDEQLPQGFVCWSADGLEMIKSNVGDLGVDDNPILAALHEKMSVRAMVPGSDPTYFAQDFGSKFSVSDDARILKGLDLTIGDAKEMGSNLLIAVKGDTGSGKSHFVRWLYQNVTRFENARYVWVIRSADSKMQVIRKFVEDLAELGSSKADELKLQIDRSFRDASDDKEKLIRQLYWELAAELNDNRQLIEGKSNPQIRNLLVGKDNDNHSYLHNLLLRYIDDELSGKIENGFVAVFRDLVENFETDALNLNTKTSLKEDGFSESVTRKILRQYERFADHNFSDLLTTAHTNCSTVTEMLNEALDVAIAKVMHMDGAGFKEIFAELRKEMAVLGQQLIIFMEDFSGVASSQNGLNKLQTDLLEVFTESASSERAPLRVVYAITDNTFQILPNNVVERHGLIVDIKGSFSSTNSTSFISKYLNVSRSNPQLVREAYTNASLQERMNTSWVPNACNSCLYRNQCHETFGKSSDGVGLYPMNDYVTEKVFNKMPTEPRHIVSRTKNFLMNSQSSIQDFTFPTVGNLDSNLLFDDIDRAEMLERRFVRTAEDGLESARKARYIHVWGRGAPPSSEESRVFKFKELGDLLKVKEPGVIDPPPNMPKTEIEDVKRIELWCASESDDRAANVLTNNLYQRLRASIAKAIVENFEGNFGKINDYKDLGLRFGDQSITVAGFLETEEKNILQPTYSVPRNEYGKSLLIGAYLQDQIRNAREVALDDGEVSQAYSSLGDFIMQSVNDLVRRSKFVEYSDHGPLGVAARCVKFINFTEGVDSGKPHGDALNRWFATSEPQFRPKTDRVDFLFSGLTELKKLVRILIDANGSYRFERMVDDLEGGPTQVLNSSIELQIDISELSEARRPRWYQEIDSDLRVKIIDFQSTASQAVIRNATVSNVAFCKNQIQDDFTFTKPEIKELANKIINNSNHSMNREDFLVSIENAFELFDFWKINRECLEETSAEVSDFDNYLRNFLCVDKFNDLCASFRSLREEFVKSDKYLQKGMSNELGIAPIEPGNLELLTTAKGVEEYVID
jgi:hypothetical protein